MTSLSRARNINVLIIGRGSIGQKHERNARALGAGVVTVDPDPQRHADFCEISQALSVHGRAFFTHAIIATPLSSHIPVLEELLEWNLAAILIEKPLAKIDELDKAMALSPRLKRHPVFVGFNWRFNPAVQALKHSLSQGKLGRMQVAQLWAREWLPRYNGRVVMESGSHILDTARYLFGELRPVASHVTNHHAMSTTDEAASFLLESADGGQLVVHVNFINVSEYDYTILVQGEKQTMVCQPDRYAPMHHLELEAFFHGETSVLATYEDGVHNLALIGSLLEKSHAGLATVS